MATARGSGVRPRVRAVLALVVVCASLTSCSDEKGGTGPDTTRKVERSSSFVLNEIVYKCSREIEGTWGKPFQRAPGLAEARWFHPSDQAEFEKYCRPGPVIEYHAVLDVLRFPTVARVIERYDTTAAWVRALDAAHIADVEYMHRILPEYVGMHIHCVIVVHSPDGTRFFLEDGDRSHDRYVEVDDTSFLASLRGAPDDDLTAFWLGLH